MRVWQKVVAVVLIGLLIGGGIGYLLLPSPAPGETKPLVAPGELDSHYAFLSGGIGGDVRVFSVPSMRLIRIIPVFSPSGQYGYARPGFLDTRPMLENSGGQLWGEAFFPVLSKTNGDYDGKWLYVQDNAHARVGMIDLRFFETENIVQVPNMESAYGLAVDPDTRYVITAGKRQGTGSEGIISFLDPHTLKVKFQIAGPEMTILNGGHDGQNIFALAPQENSLAIINIQAAEVAAGNAQKVKGVPVIDSSRVQDVLTLVPVVNNPTGIALTPDGRHVIAGSSGNKVTVVETVSQQVVAEPELGNEPVQSTVDSKGNVYTSLRADNQVVKWNLKQAIKNGNGNYIVDKIDVHYQPEFLEVMDARTKKPTDRWLLVYNQKGSDRFIDVRMDTIQNVQVIDISGAAMKIVLDSPVEPSVLDGVAVDAKKVNPWEVFPIDQEAAVKEGESRVVRTGPNSVEVYMTAERSEFGLNQFTVKEGDHVRLTITGIERVKDIIHSFALNEYDIHVSLPPGKTVTMEFVADKAGVYHYYCAIFCSALHLEMRGMMIVEPAN
jgi:nitrous-oxide reductase